MDRMNTSGGDVFVSMSGDESLDPSFYEDIVDKALSSDGAPFGSGAMKRSRDAAFGSGPEMCNADGLYGSKGETKRARSHSGDDVVLDGTSGLLDMPEEMLCTIASFLSLFQFVRLFRISKETLGRFNDPRLSKRLISEMSAARYGFQILNLIPKILTVEASSRPMLMIRFASKVKFVEVRNHQVLSAAWHRLKEQLPTLYPADSEAMRIIFMSPANRSLQSPFSNSSPIDKFFDDSRISAHWKYLWLMGLVKPPQGAVTEKMVLTVLADVRFVSRIPGDSVLAKRIAWTLFTLNGVSDKSGLFARKFGVSTAEQRKAIDPMLTRHIADWSGDLVDLCESWRPGDIAFLKSAELALQNAIAPSLLSNVTGYLGASMVDPYSERCRIALWQSLLFADIDPATRIRISKIPGLECDLFHLYDRTTKLKEMDAWRALCAEVQTLPWQMTPFFMHQLVLRYPRPTPPALINADTLDFFRAWRDRIAQRCQSVSSLSLLARAEATVLDLSLLARGLEGRVVFGKPKLVKAIRNDFLQRQADYEAYSDHVFAALPTRFWQPVLEACLRWWGPIERLSRADWQKLQQKLNQFLLEPYAALVFPSRALSEALLKKMGEGWMFRNEGALRYTNVEDLSRRFDWCKDALRKTLLGEVFKVVSQKQWMLEIALAHVKIEDAAAYRHVESKIWRKCIRPRLDANGYGETDWHAIVTQYTRLPHSRLFPKAQIYAAGVEAPH